MASWLECSTPDRVVRVRVLAGDIVLCSWARHFTLRTPEQSSKLAHRFECTVQISIENNSTGHLIVT